MRQGSEAGTFSGKKKERVPRPSYTDLENGKRLVSLLQGGQQVRSNTFEEEQEKSNDTGLPGPGKELRFDSGSKQKLLKYVKQRIIVLYLIYVFKR